MPRTGNYRNMIDEEAIMLLVLELLFAMVVVLMATFKFAPMLIAGGQ